MSVNTSAPRQYHLWDTPEERERSIAEGRIALERMQARLAETRKVNAMTPWQRWLYKTFNIEPKLKNRSR